MSTPLAVARPESLVGDHLAVARPEPLVGTRVLVTGASGFVGLPLIATLARRGTEVHALCTRSRPPTVSGVRWHRADLTDAGAIAPLIREIAPTRLVHLAWYTRHGRVWDAPENLIWLECSLKLIREFAASGGRRLVVLGTCAEYDWTVAHGPLHESHSSLEPATMYGVAKDALRRTSSAYAEREGIELAWGRLFFVYGPREHPERLVASVVRSLLMEEPACISKGAQVRDFMHVEDAAGALAALLDSTVTGEVNIASGVGVSVGEVVDRIGQLIGRPELIRRGALPDRPGEPPLLVADVARLRDEVGYRTRWELADGLVETVRWWAGQMPGQAAARRS